MNNAPILEINLSNIVHNYNLAKLEVGSSSVAAVVKANAYGLGDSKIARALYEGGCREFYVMYLSEAFSIRESVGDSKIFVLGLTYVSEYRECVEYDFIPVLNTLSNAETYDALAKSLGLKLPCVVQFDTGMTRSGLDLKEASNLESFSHLDILYIMSHLACADDPTHNLNRLKLERVKGLSYIFQGIPISFANSSGIYLGANYHFSQVRPGCMLYGINPTPYAPNPVRNVITIKAKVLQIREIDEARSVSYSSRYIAPKGSKIATIACGYADGYHRSLTSNTHCYFKGIALPIVGTITMDMMMVDVTVLSEELLSMLDYVELINDNLTVDDIAKKAKTIGYEVLTSLGNRFNRIYK